MSINYSVLKTRTSNKELDAYIGSRIKLRRSIVGMSQNKLGEHLGITFQQVQKYEKGSNRVSASMLYNIAGILNVDFSYFTEGFEKTKSLHDGSNASYEVDVSKRKETVNLLKTYYQIKDPEIRKTIVKIVKTLSAPSSKKAMQIHEN